MIATANFIDIGHNDQPLEELKRQRVETFEEDRYSWRERNEIVMRRSRTLWGKYWDWVGKHQWPARASSS